MKGVRAYSLVLAAWLLSGMAGATTETLLFDASFDDWNGVLRKVQLADESVLFEYTARTLASTNGATLAISFMPRFTCAPKISVHLPTDYQTLPASPLLEITLNSLKQVFPGLIDKDNELQVFTFAAPAKQIDELRRGLDVSAMASLRFLPAHGRAVDVQSTPEIISQSNAQSEAPEYDLFSFSLIGSRLTTLSAQRRCQSHEPPAYDPLQNNSDR